jgi:hypothetical protein
VVEHDGGVRKGAREIDQLGQVRMVEPGVEREAALAELGEAAAERRVHQQVGWCGADRGLRHRIGVPGRDLPDAAEASATGRDLGVEHGADAVEAQVGVADDAGGDPARPVIAAGRHRGHAGDEFGLTDAAHFGRAVGAVHRAAFHEHGGDDVVAGGDVVLQVQEEVADALVVIEVVVRIDDRQRGLERRLVMQSEPVGADREMRIAGGGGGGHGGFLRY